MKNSGHGSFTMQMTISKTGELRLVNGEQSFLRVQLLPFDRGYDLPAYYTTLQAVPLKRGGTCRAVRQNENCWTVRRQVGKWRLRQEVRLEADRCLLETIVEKRDSRCPSRSFNLFAIPQRSFGTGARVLSSEDGRGFWVKDAAACTDGNMTKVVFAVQMKNRALLVYSPPRTDYPLCFGCFGRAWHGFVNLPLEPKTEMLRLGRVEIRWGADAQPMLEDFAVETGRGTRLRPPPKSWNSWDYYHLSISHDRIIENARALSKSELKHELSHCVVDMGWEVRFGEWEADPNFPKGMATLAQEIKAHGFEPGLWFAPMIVDPECNFSQDDYRSVGLNPYDHPDRVYECCGIFGYVIDVTRPEGEKWLFDIFRRFRRMGYTYFKLDFLRFMMYVHHFQDRSVTNVQVMRKALRIIRAAVGDDAYIMGCNLPFEVGPGYCDAARVSGDVAIFWDCVKNNARNITCSYFLNGRWWYNDPDFLVVRGKDTSIDQRPIYRTWWFPRRDQYTAEELAWFRKVHQRESTLSLEEARTHASLEILLGGAFVLGDPIMYLNAAGRRLLRKALRTETCPGRPLNLFKEQGLSRVWVQKTGRGVRVGFFNWTDRPKSIPVDFNALGLPAETRAATDFWTDQSLVVRDRMAVKLAPHACRLLEFSAGTR